MRVNKRQLGTNGPIQVTEQPCHENQYRGHTVFYGSANDFNSWLYFNGSQYQW